MIRIAYKGKEYDLEYSRRSIKQMESWGFSINDVTEKPATMIPLLFRGAFIKNEKKVSTKLMDEIYDNLSNKMGRDNEMGFVQALCEEYGNVLNSLFDEPDNEGNGAVWSVVK